MADAVHERIQGLVSSAPVVLFMKGSKNFPQCGFSATVVQILSGLGTEYETVNVLADPEIRQGVKDYANWPTVPQLYVKGEFVGGCDIVREMYASGDLQKLLGVDMSAVEAPKVTITDAAVEALSEALEEAGEDEFIRLSIDAKFAPDMAIGKQSPTDVEVDTGKLKILVDFSSVERARGITIDFQTTQMGAGFKIDNPNAPAEVEEIGPRELKAKLESGDIKALFDVRTPAERETALIEGARHLDDDTMKELQGLDRETPIAFHCHHGGRSRTAAEHFRDQGFKKVYNLTGGIDGWSLQVDSSVPRY